MTNITIGRSEQATAAAEGDNYQTDVNEYSANYNNADSITGGFALAASSTSGGAILTSAWTNQTSFITTDANNNLSFFAYGMVGCDNNVFYGRTNYNEGSAVASASSYFGVSFLVNTPTSYYFNGGATTSNNGQGYIVNNFGSSFSNSATIDATFPVQTAFVGSGLSYSTSSVNYNFSGAEGAIGSGTLQPGFYKLNLAANIENACSTLDGTPSNPDNFNNNGISFFKVSFTTTPNTRQFTMGTSYASFASQTTSGLGTKSQLVDGTAGRYRFVAFNSFNGRGSGVASDIVDLSGMGGDTYVLQLQYDPTSVQSLGGINAFLHLQLGCLDPTTGTWVNAVLDNTDGGAGAHEVFGAYDSNSDFHLGYYGLDTADGMVWAVLNYDGTFAVIDAVPEPSVWAMLLGSVALLVVGRHNRVRARHDWIASFVAGMLPKTFKSKPTNLCEGKES